MRFLINGLLVGFRVRQGGKQSSDYGVLDLLQVGDKDRDSVLKQIIIQDLEVLQFFLESFSDGQFRWLDLLVVEQLAGKEYVLFVEKIVDFRVFDWSDVS